jgi:feruloyl esterase
VTLNKAPQCSAESFTGSDTLRIHSISSHRLPAAHCKVSGTIETEINFELLLPENWNGKFAMGGGGGFVGSVVNTAVYYGALQSGYATIGTDTGHRGHSIDASWALNNPRRIENFGHRAVHLTAVHGKQLVKDYYGRPSGRNYFIGCSRGGGQALMEAQRYPSDFDGIVAGAPAYNWHYGIGVNATQITQEQFPDPVKLQRAVVTPEDQALIAEGYLARCDALDGVEDGILNHPPSCDFELGSLRCPGKENGQRCLDDEKINALQRIYGGAVIDGENVWPGFPFGGETAEGGMTAWLTGGLDYNSEHRSAQDNSEFEAPVMPNASFGFGTGVMKYLIFHEHEWDYSTYDFDGFAVDSAAAAAILSATDPDLSAFRARGGKLLMYHGWSDMALSALGTIDYYERVLTHDADAAQDVRLYLMPGVNHCFGGAGPSLVNFLTHIDRWVESGEAPGAIDARWLQWGVLPSGSRPLCPYPQQALYDGIGDTRDAGSFSCVAPWSGGPWRGPSPPQDDQQDEQTRGADER